MKIALDTSIIIDGKISQLVEAGELKVKGMEVIIPQMVLDELQSQATKRLEIGWDGLREIKKLRELGVTVTTVGRLPTAEEISMAKKGRIDALIRQAAKEHEAVLYTADMVQAEVAEADGVKVVFVKHDAVEELLFEKYLTDDMMSLHLKEGALPRGKKGKPGNILLTDLGSDILTRDDLEALADNIVQVARHRSDGHFEIAMKGAEVVQLGRYRIAITRPPFSKDMEITIVRPVVKLTLEDYKPSEKLMKRLAESAEGVIVAGPPGSGKTTFVQSLAEFYANQGKIVKTMESPRDLSLPAEITQYSPLQGSMENTADILLLVRPDYTVYDELRKTKDFNIFTDMRLGGVGMIGVTHATKAIDGIQRFMSRTELGMIPHIIDTLIFVKAGRIEKIHAVNMLVKVPSGMREQDLARPVIEVRDFENNKLEYEIYSYGEENVVIPIGDEKKSGKSAVEGLASKKIVDVIRKYDKNAEVDFVSGNRVKIRVREDVIPRIIGKAGKNIESIEKELGISIDVQAAQEDAGQEVDFQMDESGAHMVLKFGKKLIGQNANIHVDGDYLFTATVGKSGQIRISKTSDIGNDIMSALESKRKISVLV